MEKQDAQERLQEQILACLLLLPVACVGFYGGVWQLIQAAISNNSSVMTLLLLLLLLVRSHASLHEALNILTVPPSPDRLVLSHSLCRFPPRMETTGAVHMMEINAQGCKVTLRASVSERDSETDAATGDRPLTVCVLHTRRWGWKSWGGSPGTSVFGS